MKSDISEGFLVSPFFVFFLIFSNVIGVGILSFQRVIAKVAGYDAWISVILTGVSIHLILWLTYRILEIAKNDIIFINRFCFGKWMGSLLNIFFVLYFFSLAFIVYRVYIELVQVWMFPLMKPWQIGSIFLVLFYYIVSGGFRTIIGICFWGTIIPFFILFPLSMFAFEYVNLNHVLPVLNHSITEILGSAKTMFVQYLGFETLFMLYPFIKNPEKSKRWAHLSVFVITILYLYVTILTFLYFSEEHLKHTTWPSITLMKIAEIPLIERFEYVVVSFWFLLVLPNICIKLWSACRAVRKLINIKQRTILAVFLILLLVFSNMVEDSRQIDLLVDISSKVGFYVVYLYIPFLFLVINIKEKIR